MRRKKKGTKIKWFNEGQLKEARKWLKKNKKDYQADFIFKDPTHNWAYIGLEEPEFFQCKR